MWDIILEAVRQADVSKVYSLTDELSTVYRGRRQHVLDALKACFTGAYREGVHMVLEATLSKGCPGDTEGGELSGGGRCPAERAQDPGRALPGNLEKFPCTPWGWRTICLTLRRWSTVRWI